MMGENGGKAPEKDSILEYRKPILSGSVARSMNQQLVDHLAPEQVILCAVVAVRHSDGSIDPKTMAVMAPGDFPKHLISQIEAGVELWAETVRKLIDQRRIVTP